MPTLGALTVLAKSPIAPVKQAALTAIVELQKRRPDVALPHPDLVAQVVDNLKAEAARRQAEAEAEEAEAEAEAARQAELGDSASVPPRIDEGNDVVYTSSLGRDYCANCHTKLGRSDLRQTTADARLREVS